eukprot:CAMPEP_0206170098 /NCGR_PEP_ID=MMETSP1474-20131121/37776_1 /ASSEMBLY_ACC=CAM_ASM_001110 /TAXON_ID=97495 /ORGANISM="Imantonia sp., Strain RCC918" /LENGTH=289 /DNA_ID=CAMNT_0053576561 /DNA_START=82 /DNA_END=948 /DNA_ORIENTATION=-
MLLILASIVSWHGGARVASRRGEVRMAAGTDVPSIIYGGGRIGSLLKEIGCEGDAVVKRGEPFPAEPAQGPIYVATRNDALAGIIADTPAHRREDLVFMQNGMLDAFLASQGLADATQVLLYLAVTKLGAEPIDGITDLCSDGLTSAKGKWAGAFRARLANGGLTCQVKEGAEYDKAMLEKHIWICSFMLVGALHGGLTVGQVESEHSAELRALVAELAAAGEVALGVSLEAGVYDRLAAYGRSVHFFPTAVKEFEWRNGWFYELSQRAAAEGKPDPLPLHTAGLEKLG